MLTFVSEGALLAVFMPSNICRIPCVIVVSQKAFAYIDFSLLAGSLPMIPAWEMRPVKVRRIMSWPL